MIMAEIVFWIAFSLLFYTFAGYPLILKAFSLLLGKQNRTDDYHEPSVSMVLSVYNERAVIKGKIDNFLALDYPFDKLDLIIVSDCSDDGTDEIVRSFDVDRIRLLVQSQRSGKTRNLNLGVVEAKGEVIVFTDANSMYDQDAVRKLVRHFADPNVCLVSGKSEYLDEAGSATSGGVYRYYEDFIKAAESQLAGIVGADGAIYALRRNLYVELRPEYINDFIHTLEVVRKGCRAISDDGAVCREVVKASGSGELRRQTRIMAQSWLIFITQFGSLITERKLVYAWQLFSHKFMRWLTVPLMAVLFTTDIVLFDRNMFYQAVFVALTAFMGLALLGRRSLVRGVLRIPHVFMVLHWAALAGLFKYLTGNIYTTWNPRGN